MAQAMERKEIVSIRIPKVDRHIAGGTRRHAVKKFSMETRTYMCYVYVYLFVYVYIYIYIYVVCCSFFVCVGGIWGRGWV